MIAKAMFDKEGSKRVINALKFIERLDNTIYLIISDEGMQFLTMDRSHIQIASLKLKPSYFEFNNKEELTFKPDCEYLKKVLNAYRKGKELFIIVKEKELIIEYFSDVNEIEFQIQFGTLDEHDKPPVPPKVEWPAKYTVCVPDLKDAVCSARSFTDKIYFESAQETDFILTCHADGYGERSSKKDGPVLSMKASFQTEETYNGRVYGCYNTDRLSNSLVKPFSNEITIGLNEDAPLLLIFDLEGVGQLTSLLAPRIESEE